MVPANPGTDSSRDYTRLRRKVNDKVDDEFWRTAAVRINWIRDMALLEYTAQIFEAKGGGLTMKEEASGGYKQIRDWLTF